MRIIKVRKLAFGDYIDANGQTMNGFAQAGNYAQLAAPLVDGADPVNSYGSRSDFGAGASGALKGMATGASLGSVVPGIGTAVGAVGGAIVGGVTGVINNNKKQEEEKLALERQNQVEIDNIKQYSKGVLSTYPSYGITRSAKYGMKFPNGGVLPYPTDADADVNVLSSNMAQYEGDTHEQGGIPLDNNVEIEDQEVIKDNMVLSDRLNPSKIAKQLISGLGVTVKNKDTYASTAEKFGKKIGKYEENLNSTRLGEKGTAQLMIKQLDDAVNTLFKDQQLQKHMIGIKDSNKMYTGGTLDKLDHSPTTINKLWNKVEKNPLGTTSAQLYDIYDREMAADYTKQYGPGFSYTNPSKAYLGFKDNNSLVPEMMVRSEVASPSVNYGKQYKFNDPTQPDYNNMNSLRQSGYLPKDTPKLAFGDYIPRKKLSVDPMYLNSQQAISNLAVPTNTNKNLTIDPVYLNTQDAINNLSMPGSYVPPSNGGGTIETLRPDVTITKSDKPTFDETLNNNLGNIATGIGSIANQAMINKLETEYTPTLTKAPNYNFNSRLPYLTNQVKQAYRTASAGINGSSAQDNLALKSNMFGKALESINAATADEFARQDQFDTRYNEMTNRTNLVNTNSINQAKFESQDNRNQKLALTQQNIDSVIKGIIGNKTVKDQQELDFAKNYMELLKGDQTGVSKRLLEKMPPHLRRKYIGNYYK